MRAVVLRDHGGPEVLTIEEVEDPVPGPDQILVDVAHTALNRADILQRQGGYPDPRNLPLEIPGLEYAGTVAAIGADVVEWAIGDPVMGIEAGGCYAEKVVTHARQALRVPDSVELVDAAAISEVFLTAWDALVVQGGLTSGRWALIHAGASGVGTAGIQISKAIGAYIAVTCSAGKADACRELGADLVLERSPSDWLGALRAELPVGVDTILDVVGGDEADRNIKAAAAEGDDRAGRIDGWWPGTGEHRFAANEADHLDRHNAASTAARTQARSLPALQSRDASAVRLG